MRWLIGVAAVAVALGVAGAGAQEAVSADVTLAPTRVTVGDRITLTITVEHDAEVSVSVPDDFEAFDPLDLIAILPSDTREIGGGRMESSFSFELAAFLIGEVELKPIAIKADGAEALYIEAQVIHVDSVVPPDAPLQLRGLKGPLKAGTGPPKRIWAALFMAGFAAVSVFTMALARVPTLSAPPAPRPAPSPPGQKPDEAALEQLDQIAEGHLVEQGELSEYYRRISEVLRDYLTHRFDVAASAMTPRELEERLEATSMNKLAVRQAVATLEQCQSVQFAGYIPARERAEADLAAAAEIVRLTSDSERAEATER